MFSLSIKPRLIVGFVIFLLLLIGSYLFQERGETIGEQKEKIKQLEVNQTFAQHDHVVEVENAITQTNSKNRDKKLKELLHEEHTKKNNDVNTTYDESIFDGLYLYKTDLP